MGDDLNDLLARIRACRACEPKLPLGPRPIPVADARARILVAGQAPGKRVHESGVAWNDASGKRLREWLGLSEEQFYDPADVALVPMGFCYPGTGASGDNPPTPDCRRLWHDVLFQHLPNLRLKIIIGQYAQAYHLAERAKATLTETVAAWREYATAIYPIPHPSPRNQMWLNRNPWFKSELVPDMQASVLAALHK
ncbi:uracil-DNA glycosylase family protein [Telmatospirillum sp.]|uniref:uracil-DNA glycosylase family protein n=1 Tax=Telmatospirillum sp. TaxID=2079197 RepID=UPI0028465159|nr:uracil-DNA glycosylase family protein [Telmatospirillum sp.]MDR3440478.1 uracil-DNA glycosylase family protein [Telmatospirillum sp.]